MSDAADITVVVPTYKRPTDLRRCLDGLDRQTYRPREVVVVVRGDDVESRTIADSRSRVRVVTVDTPGQVRALNAGVDASISELIAFTDDDAVPRPDWVKRILEQFALDDRIGAVGGRDVVHHEHGVEHGRVRNVGRAYRFGRVVGGHHLGSRLQDVDFLKGANMAYRRAALQPFEEALRGAGAQVCNDLEASWSARCRGWRVVYDPSVVVDHYPAHRHDGDGRNRKTAGARQDAAYNQMYALLRHADFAHAIALLVYSLAIGARGAPGFFLGWRRTEQGSGAWKLALARLAGARDAFHERVGDH